MGTLRVLLYDLATDKRNGFFPSVGKFFLWVASCGYGLGVRFLAWYCASTAIRLPCKVISVGNISLGGTGKTVLVEFIAGYLRQQGHKVAVLSRGYKRKYRVPRTAYREKTEGYYEEMGDEPAMLKMRLKDVPVIVDHDRARGARLAIAEYGVDTVILDDGFQQWKLKKDLEIVAIDAGCSFGNMQVIPRGVLREPLSALQRADVFVITKTNLNPEAGEVSGFLKSFNPGAPVFESEHALIGFYLSERPGSLAGIDALKGKKAVLVSGIGDPVSFEKIIAQSGVSIGHAFAFPDHHPYTENDAERIFRECRERAIDTVITTEKDSVRFVPVMGSKPKNVQVWIVRIALRLKNDEQGFCIRLRGIYSA
jgi:tetraacyldisaccharide 4'-kinase